jgi:YidC/Oxa1 family membrane protein insertase
MNLFSLLYTEFLFRPLFNLLVGITSFLPTHNVGVSILIVTFIVRLILLPPSIHQAKAMQNNQAKMGNVKKEIKKINEKYKNNQAKKSEATMALYKEAGINPASGCLPLLIQLPILIALYRVFLTGMGPETNSYLYAFVSRPEAINMSFINIDLAQSSLVLALIAGAFQFVLMRMASPSSPPPTSSANDQSAAMMTSMQKNMAYLFPVMTVFISMQLPAALALYWAASTIFGVVQQYFVKKKLNISNPTPI